MTPHDALPPPGFRPTTVGALLQRLTPRAFVTPSIVVLLVGSFVLSLLRGLPLLAPTARQLVEVGGSFGPLMLEGQWWRLWTATLLHAGVVHLAFNLWALWSAGLYAERVFGNAAYAAIYVFSGFGSSLLSVTMSPLVVSVGASGAVFGVYGALLGFVVTHSGVLPKEFLTAQRNSLLAFVGYNVVFGLSQPNIDLWGHAGGFVVGFVAGIVLARDLLAPASHRARRALAALAIALGLLLAGVGVRARLAALARAGFTSSASVGAPAAPSWSRG